MLLRKRKGRLPDFLVIGAMKAGTTTLHTLLNAHPDIFMSAEKELNYFSMPQNWQRGEQWYRRQFASDALICGESSPSYADWPRWPGVPERMHALLPSARLVLSVRDPVARAVSHYKHRLADGRERRPIDAALHDEIYLHQGRYHMQIMHYLKAGYREDDILIVQAEHLRLRRETTVSGILQFLGVPEYPTAWSSRPDIHLSRRKRVPTPAGRALRAKALPALRQLPSSIRGHVERGLLWPLSTPMPRCEPSPATVDALRAALREDVASFRRLTGQDLDDWQV